MKKNKILKSLAVLVMLIMQFFSFTTTVNAANIGETKNLERGAKGYYCVQKWNGSSWIYLTYNQTFYTDTDGQKYVAYCLDPGKPGVGYVSGEKETYQVRITELLNNDVIWRVLKNGYPNKSISQLGVETADDAYFATMQAINSILRGYTLNQAKELYSVGKFSINGENLQDIQRRGNKTLTAMYNLIDIGLNGTETRSQFLSISIKSLSDFKKENDNYYSQTFSVQSASEISEYNIEKIENLPQGSYIVDESGNKKQTFKGGEKFKLIVPQSSILKDFKGKISIKAKQKSYPIYFGASTIEGFQDYALCNNTYSEAYAETEINIQTNKSKLTLVKVDKDTQKPMQGVKFQIKFSDGTINTFVTDKNGEIVLSNQRPGTIIIKEIQTLENYKLNTNEIRAELKYNETTEIKIENELQKGNIKVIKIDKDNNKIKLANVKFQLKDESGKVIKEGKTDKNGELLFENIVVGKYKIIETESNKDYNLSGEEIVVKVIDGKTQEVKVENELKKGRIKVVKIDKDNKNVRIPDVEFKVYDEKGNEVDSLKTDKNGEATSKELPINQKYKVKEVKTLETYVLNETLQTVVLKDNEITTIKFENERKKGAIRIIKVDKDNNEIRLKNVKFQLKDEKGNVVKEGTTNENGEILFDNIVVGKYKIVEIETNEKYKILNEGIDVEVVNGKTKDIYIENEKIPEIINKELPKTGNENGTYEVICNLIVVSSYNLCMLIKKILVK